MASQFKLLTIGNTKTRKGEAHGYLTVVLHLSPSTSAGLGNICPQASAGCIATCLNTAGRGGIFRPGESTNAIQEARKRRTALLKLDPERFETLLASEIATAGRIAKRMRLTLAVRINGTSDLPALAIRMARRFPRVQFYDYTKLPLFYGLGSMPENLHHTFSRSENNGHHVYDALKRGWNVAVVFSTRKGAALPDRWAGYRVIDGDETDLRFLDDRGGHIIGLRAKGKARRDTSGFVVRV